jgi:hypothetical protein
LPAQSKQVDKDLIEQRWDGTMGQAAISCTEQKLLGSLPELRLTEVEVNLQNVKASPSVRKGKVTRVSGVQTVEAAVALWLAPVARMY